MSKYMNYMYLREKERERGGGGGGGGLVQYGTLCRGRNVDVSLQGCEF